MNAGGPYINVAALCEKVLQEQDGTLSLIRVVDRIVGTATGTAIPAELPPIQINLFAVVVMRSGIFKGTAPLKIIPRSPDESSLGEFSADVFLEGDDRGVNVISQLQFPAKEEGLYWIDVLLQGEILTRIPLRIIYQRLSQGSFGFRQNPSS
jgi:hypothetical protein